LVPVEREIILNTDNYVDAGTRRKSRRMINEESIRRKKETNRTKVQEETERQLREEEERIIFNEVMRRIQKRKDMKLRDEFYDFEKFTTRDSGMTTPKKRAEGDDLTARDKSATMIKFMDESKEYITSKELKLMTEANRSGATSMTTYINFGSERKLRDEREKKSKEESERRTIEKQNSKELKAKIHMNRGRRSAESLLLFEDIIGEGSEGRVERIREGFEMIIKPDRRNTISGDMIANQKSEKAANEKKIREKNVSKLMQEYEKNIKVEIDNKLALEKEKKTRSTKDINGVISNTKKS
jgi:hypothetical protein